MPNESEITDISSFDKEEFFLFFPHTTGLRKPKGKKSFISRQNAIDAGRAMNILDSKPDRIFVVLSASEITCYTNITDPLPFSDSFFRFNRLSDRKSKFSNKIDSLDLTGLPIEKQNIVAGLGLKISQDSQIEDQNFKSNNKGKSYFDILSSCGLIGADQFLQIQNLIHFKLGISPIQPQITAQTERIYHALSFLFPSLQEANSYISSHIVERLQNYGQKEIDKKIFLSEGND